MPDRKRNGSETEAKRKLILELLAARHPTQIGTLELAEQLGISTRAVRDHLDGLAGAGLVFRNGHRGAGLTPAGLAHPAALRVREQRAEAVSGVQEREAELLQSERQQLTTSLEMSRLRREQAEQELAERRARSLAGRQQVQDATWLATEVSRTGRRVAREFLGRTSASRLTSEEVAAIGEVVLRHGNPAPLLDGVRERVKAEEQQRLTWRQMAPTLDRIRSFSPWMADHAEQQLLNPNQSQGPRLPAASAPPTAFPSAFRAPQGPPQLGSGAHPGGSQLMVRTGSPAAAAGRARNAPPLPPAPRPGDRSTYAWTIGPHAPRGTWVRVPITK